MRLKLLNTEHALRLTARLIGERLLQFLPGQLNAIFLLSDVFLGNRTCVKQRLVGIDEDARVGAERCFRGHLPGHGMHGRVQSRGDRLEQCLVLHMWPNWLQLLGELDESEFGPFAVACLEILRRN